MRYLVRGTLAVAYNVRGRSTSICWLAARRELGIKAEELGTYPCVCGLGSSSSLFRLDFLRGRVWMQTEAPYSLPDLLCFL